MTSESLFDGMWDGKFNRKTQWKTIVVIAVILIALSARGIQIHNQMETQRQQELAETKARENAPKIIIQMIWYKWTWAYWLNFEYLVSGADEVYFNEQLVSPSSGTNYFSQFVKLTEPITNIFIRGHNKYQDIVQTFSLNRKKTAQEIQADKDAEQAQIQADKEAERARIAEEKYKNSPAYKKQILQDKADFLNTDVWWEFPRLAGDCQNLVKLNLKSPSSAEFPWGIEFIFSVKRGKLVADSYVDADNPFWVKLRTYFECIYQVDGDTVTLDSFKRISS